MRTTIVVAAIALGAVIAAVFYLTDDSRDQSPATIQSASEQAAGAKSVTPAMGAQLNSVSHGDTVSQPMRTALKPVPADPRLEGLMVSPDNGLIEFVVGSDGKVIKEIDNDPSSLGFKKPLREYTYFGENVIGLTSYRYFGDHVQIVETGVSYKPDGSVDEYLESTSYDYGEKSEGDS